MQCITHQTWHFWTNCAAMLQCLYLSTHQNQVHQMAWLRNKYNKATQTSNLSQYYNYILQGAALKNDPTPKMWLLSNSRKILRQILYTCSAGSCPLMCCFSRKLLYICEIDIMPNFKFEFCICTSLFLRDVTFCRIISKFTGKKLEVELHKNDT